MPISSAAMSMSRTAIHMRPIRPWTRFEANQVRSDDDPEHARDSASPAWRFGPVTGTPKRVRVGTSIAPEML